MSTVVEWRNTNLMIDWLINWLIEGSPFLYSLRLWDVESRLVYFLLLQRVLFDYFPNLFEFARAYVDLYCF